MLNYVPYSGLLYVVQLMTLQHIVIPRVCIDIVICAGVLLLINLGVGVIQVELKQLWPKFHYYYAKGNPVLLVHSLKTRDFELSNEDSQLKK
jgi:hypothetical protein